MTTGRKKFGALVRREREAKEIGLREMAKKIGVSPTYLSKIERDDFAPPAEDKVKEIAEIIGCDPTNCWPGRVGVATDLSDIITSAHGNWRRCCGPPRADGRRHGPAGAAGTEGEGQVTAWQRRDDAFCDDADEDETK